MATPAALKALKDTTVALRDIRSKVEPFLQTLRRHQAADNVKAVVDSNDVAVARAGVALTLGTLRFLAHRLRGSTAASAAPLRTELNRMRQLLVRVQNQAASRTTTAGTKHNNNEEDKDDDDDPPLKETATPQAKRRRIK